MLRAQSAGTQTTRKPTPTRQARGNANRRRIPPDAATAEASSGTYEDIVESVVAIVSLAPIRAIIAPANVVQIGGGMAWRAVTIGFIVGDSYGPSPPW